MTSPELWSDGTALTNPFGDLFSVEVTTAIGRCTNLQVPVPQEA